VAARSSAPSATDVRFEKLRLERLEKTPDQEVRAESKTQIVEQINGCLRSGDYSRALELLRSSAAEFPNDEELSDLEKRAQDGIKSSAEANRLITESQELFAQSKSPEAIQLLRKAYELDKNNSLARAILANALVEHAQSMVETNWLEAETLTNQALTLNPAHPTAKTILGLIVRKKETGSVEDWVSQARKLQSSGDLFAALGWVAEGLAVHPHDPKLLQLQDEIQRDQDARRRQARRGDLDDLRRMQKEIDGATDIAAKQALAVRIQTVAAKHWTDGEILSIANALLLRLGLVSEERSEGSPRGKGAALILHVPRPNAPKPLPDRNKAPLSTVASGSVPPRPALSTQATTKEVAASSVLETPVPQEQVLPIVPPKQVTPSPVLSNPTPAEDVPTGIVPPSKIPLRTPPRGKLRASPTKTQFPTQQASPVSAVEPFVTTTKFASPSPLPKQPERSNSTRLVVVSSVAAIILVGALLLFTRKHQGPRIVTTPAATPTASAPTPSAPIASVPPVSAPAPVVSGPAEPEPEKSSPAPPVSSDTASRVAPDNQPAAEPSQNHGTLVVVAGQDNAKVFLNGKLQPQLTQTGQLRLPNLEPKEYVVQISKTGFQDSPRQKIRVRKGEEARLIFNLQPQPRLDSLTIQGGTPGTTVLVDQTPIGSVQPDGTLLVSTVNPGDHTVELRKDRFKPRQFKKHFVAGGAIMFAPADVALEAVPSELKITFTPTDASVAIVKGDFLKLVSSGVPLNVAAGTYTLTARTSDRFTRSSTFEVVAGQSRILDLSLAPNGMSKWEDPSSWKHEGDSFTRKGGDFVLYGVVPASGTFAFSAMLTKGHLLQWVLDYTDPKNYVLFQIDDNNFYRSVIHNGEKTDEIIVPHKGDKKSFRTLQIRVSSTELIHEIKQGDRWTVLDRWTQPGTNLSLGKFGFHIPGNDQITISSFAHYADLNIR
jgi:tetratricopeptide (TPR) repeat protein